MTTKSSDLSKLTSYFDASAKGAPVEYDSLLSKFNGITKDFVLRANNVVSTVYTDDQLLVTTGGTTLDNEDYHLYDHVHSPIFFDQFDSGYVLDRSAIVVSVSSTTLAKDTDVYQLNSNNCVIFTARLVESSATSITLTNVRASGNLVAINTSPVIVGTIIGRKGGTATVSSNTVSYVSVIGFSSAPTKYNKHLKIRRISTSDTSPKTQRVFNNLVPFNPINIMLSE